MTNLKHYRLGCGESLQSDWLEIARQMKARQVARAKLKLTVQPKSRQGKKH